MWARHGEHEVVLTTIAAASPAAGARCYGAGTVRVMSRMQYRCECHARSRNRGTSDFNWWRAFLAAVRMLTCTIEASVSQLPSSDPP